MIYAVRLKSKTEGEDGRRENNNPYLIVEGGKIKYIDHIYGNKSEFNFNDEVHTVAKEIFISGLKNAIKEEILQLKQLELVLEEMNLKECIGDTLQESATFLQNVRKFIGVGEKSRSVKMLEEFKETLRRVLLAKYSIGFIDGYETGKADGYTEGYTDGTKAGGFTDGYRAGKTDGYREGHEGGIKAGGFVDGYETGYEVGYKEGSEDERKGIRRLSPGEKIGEQ